jgi:phosphoribosyl 1,2-cyclic phosphodiesterase
VYATAQVWDAVGLGVAPDLCRVVEPGTSYRLGALRFEIVPVVHSAEYPTVAVLASAAHAGRRGRVFVAHDIAALTPEASRLLRRAGSYVGDGASYNRTVRPRGAPRGHAAGHASVREQLRWCAEAGVRRAWFTHCGTQVLRGGPQGERRWADRLAAESDVRLSFATDGLAVRLWPAG